MCDCLAPGGGPLWSVSSHPRKFRHVTSRAETCENRRLPGTTHRFAVLWSGCKRIESHGQMHRAGLFAGAARCDILWSDGALKQRSSGLAARVKAAPLQALGTHTFVLHSQIFERTSTITTLKTSPSMSGTTRVGLRSRGSRSIDRR